MNDVSDLIQYEALRRMTDASVDPIVNAVAETAQVGGIAKFEPTDAERFAYIGDDVFGLIVIAEVYASRYNGNFSYMLDMKGALTRFHRLTAPQAKGVLNCMLAEARRNTTPKASPVPAAKLVLEDGMYRMDGTIYKVQHAVHGSGNQYAKELIRTEAVEASAGSFQYGPIEAKPAGFTFAYAQGAVSKLRPEHRMTLEEAKAFGALYGVCCVCGATLTDEKSIANGIGPVCEGRV